MSPLAKNNIYLILTAFLIAIILFAIFINLTNSQNISFFNQQINNQIEAFSNEKSYSSKNKDITKTKYDKIIDGDTIEISNNARVRLLNIDTPESVKANTPVMCYALEAKAKFNQLLANSKEIYLSTDKEKTDQYGRELRFVYTDEQDAIDQNIEKSINAQLVNEGYARAVFYEPNTTYKKQFLKFQQDAIDQKIGVWKNCPKPFIT